MLSCNNNELNGEIITLYYGTDDLTRLRIDPQRYLKEPMSDSSNMKVFEFGGGFYLTPQCNVAVQYAFQNLFKKSKFNTNSDKTRKDTMKGGMLANIHMYKFNLDQIMNLDNRICIQNDEYKNVLKSTLQGYHQNPNYYPNKFLTYGLLCGDYWDNTFKNANSQLISSIILNIDNFISDCVSNMKYVYDDYDKKICATQYCLHQDTKPLIEHRYITIEYNDVYDDISKIKYMLEFGEIVDESGDYDDEEIG